MKGGTTEVDDELSQWYREYRFRKSFSITHEDFMAQPIDVTDWLNDIDNIVVEVESEQAQPRKPSGWA